MQDQMKAMAGLTFRAAKDHMSAGKSVCFATKPVFFLAVFLRSATIQGTTKPVFKYSTATDSAQLCKASEMLRD